LSGTKDYAVLAHASRSSLSYTLMRTLKEFAQNVHHFILVNQIVVFLKEPTELLKKLSQDFKAFLLDFRLSRVKS
jgi:hypothetical protein